LFADGLHAGGSVDMDDRRNSVAPFGADIFCDQHERRILLALEYLFCPFGQYDRRERPECLPVLDPLVQDILHFGFAWVREQAAVTKRARPEFGAALKPADHTLIGKQSCRLAADILAARYGGLNANEEWPGSVLDVLFGVAPADIGMIHDE
jgi:hypothetical protein